MRVAPFRLKRHTMNKAELRQIIRKRKQLLTPDLREKASAEIMRRLENRQEFQTARHILLYHALPDEVETSGFLEKWSGSKNIYLPIVVGDTLEIAPYRKDTLRCGSFGILEPSRSECVPTDSIELAIVPGMAFDRKLNRLGRGKGYYDRLLSQTSLCRIGICYGFQLLDDIPAEAHDIRMNAVITENEEINF